MKTSSIQPIIEYFNQKSSFERKTKSRQSWQFLVQAAQSPEQPALKLAGSVYISIFIRMILYFGIVNNGLKTT